MHDISLTVVRETWSRIAPYVRHTPLMPTPVLRGELHPRLQLKLENMQVAGSFKARGAFNNLLLLNEAQRARGIVTASGGNHGLAVACAARTLGVPATVYLPASAGTDRVARIAAWGVELAQHGSAWDDAHHAAIAHAEAAGLAYIHPFDAQATVEGQATLGLELLNDLPALDCVLIAIGGGGLIAGMAAAIKQVRPTVRVIGVEPVGAPTMLRSLEAGRVVELAEVRTIADTLAPRTVSERTLELARHYVDEIVLVDDRQMIAAMRRLWFECNQLVEPAGAAALAALLSGAVSIAGAEQPVALVCGGNAAAESVFAGYET